MNESMLEATTRLRAACDEARHQLNGFRLREGFSALDNAAKWQVNAHVGVVFDTQLLRAELLLEMHGPGAARSAVALARGSFGLLMARRQHVIARVLFREGVDQAKAQRVAAGADLLGQSACLFDEALGDFMAMNDMRYQAHARLLGTYARHLRACWTLRGLMPPASLPPPPLVEAVEHGMKVQELQVLTLTVMAHAADRLSLAPSSFMRASVTLDVLLSRWAVQHGVDLDAPWHRWLAAAAEPATSPALHRGQAAMLAARLMVCRVAKYAHDEAMQIQERLIWFANLVERSGAARRDLVVASHQLADALG